MTNGRKGDLLHYHFSADEMYILPILVCQRKSLSRCRYVQTFSFSLSLSPAQIVAFILHFFLTFLTIWSAVILRQRQLLHATYKLFMVSVFIHVREIDNLTSDSDGERNESQMHVCHSYLLRASECSC